MSRIVKAERRNLLARKPLRIVMTLAFRTLTAYPFPSSLKAKIFLEEEGDVLI